MIKHKNIFQKITIALLFSVSIFAQKQARIVEDFNKNWNFKLGDHPEATNANFNSSDWRTLQLPHDWSIEGTFDKNSKTKQAQGFLPAGKGWYRKVFTVSTN